jgi:hypothetical protein
MAVMKVFLRISLLSFLALSVFFAESAFFAPEAKAQVTNSIVREPRSMAMGGTGVALADDEYALFHNPAGLAGQETRRFRILGLTLEASVDTYSVVSTSLSAFSNFSISSLNQLMGKDINLRAGLVPMIQLPHFAITYFVDVQGSLNEFNLANPTFTLGDMITHGVQAGMGWNLLKGGKKSTEELRVGIAGKMLFRKGGFYDIGTAGFLQATSNGKQYINNLLGSYGTGFGVDLGLQYVNKVGRDTNLFAGYSMTDVGGTKFSDPHASPIPMNISLGVGAEKNLELFKVKVDADFRNINAATSFANKTHFGTELSLPLFDLDLGLSQMNLTFGATFDVWILRVSAVSYAEEYGIQFHQDTSRKYLLQVDFALPI